MSKRSRIVIWLFLSTLLLAFIVRFFNLAKNPPALDWDEASIGYNAYSVLKTGRDEYGQFFPLSFQSFGDFKPPLYIYLAIFPIAIFDLNEFSVRFPSALLGTVAVFISFFCVTYLFGSFRTRDKIALMACLFLAISPWHVQFSRAAFEANIGLFLTIAGIWFFMLGLKRAQFFILSVFTLLLSLYAYHSNRLVIPVFILGLLIYFRKTLLRDKRGIAIAAAVGVIITLPLIVSFFTMGGISARFKAVTALQVPDQLTDAKLFRNQDEARGEILGGLLHNRRILYSLNFISAYIDHFNLPYLFLKGDVYIRHNAHGMGILYLGDLFFIILGIYELLRSSQKDGRFVIFLWFFVAPLASALTKGTPHAVRSLLYLPTYQIFSALGCLSAYSYAKSRGMKILKIVIIFLLPVNFLYYLDLYHIHTPFEVSQAWQYGYKQAMAYVKENQGRFSKVIFTNKYDQPYIYFLFFNKIDPFWYQEVWNNKKPSQDLRSFDKYEFRRINWETDDDLREVLIVGSSGDPPEIPAENVTIAKEINFLDGSVAFRIVER